MKRAFLLCATIALLLMKVQAQTVTDYDGNVYTTVTIGTQVWLVENLKVTHYRNGDAIPNVSDAQPWSVLTTGAYCEYNNTPSNGTTYGKLYNWYAVHDSRNIAPVGWHVPTNEEWSTLTTYLGGIDVAGGKLKETGTSHWEPPNMGATNETGFTALPGGERTASGSFIDISMFGFWRTSTEYDATHARILYMDYQSDNVYQEYYSLKNGGLSVRCIKDNGTQINEFKNNINIQIFPNPAFNSFEIKYESGTDTRAYYQIIDLTGKIVQQDNLNGQSKDINISQLPKGIYSVKIVNGDKVCVKKLSKL